MWPTGKPAPGRSHGSGRPMKRSCFCTKLLNGPLTSLEKRSCRRSKPCRQNTVTCWQRKGPPMKIISDSEKKTRN
ncbi:Fe2+ transport protein FeoA, partial [Dysosmobacter welbionis]